MAPDQKLQSSPTVPGFWNRVVFFMFRGIAMLLGLLSLAGALLHLPGSWLWMQIISSGALLSGLLWTLVRWRRQKLKRGLWYLLFPGGLLLTHLLLLPRPGITLPIALSILLLTGSLSQEVHQ